MNWGTAVAVLGAIVFYALIGLSCGTAFMGDRVAAIEIAKLSVMGIMILGAGVAIEGQWK